MILTRRAIDTYRLSSHKGSILAKIWAALIMTTATVLVASPSSAANVTLLNSARSGIWHFSIECFRAAGQSSGVTLGELPAGRSIEEGNTDCATFTLKFSSTNGDKETYKLEAGKRYKYFWNVDHWDLEPA